MPVPLPVVQPCCDEVPQITHLSYGLPDKLAETKRAEREAKEAHKAALQASKQKSHEVTRVACQ